MTQDSLKFDSAFNFWNVNSLYQVQMLLWAQIWLIIDVDKFSSKIFFLQFYIPAFILMIEKLFIINFDFKKL